MDTQEYNMRTLVIQRGTGLFLGAQGTWVKRKDLAIKFKSSNQALDYCLSKGLNNLDFLLHFDDSTWDIRVADVLHRTAVPSVLKQHQQTA